MLDFFQCLPFRLYKAEVQEQKPKEADPAVEPEGSVQLKAILDVQVRLRCEEQEHIAGGSCNATGETARPEGEDFAQQRPRHLADSALREREDDEECEW